MGLTLGNKILQTPGQSTRSTMSQKAITDTMANPINLVSQLCLIDDNSDPYTDDNGDLILTL